MSDCGMRRLIHSLRRKMIWNAGPVGSAPVRRKLTCAADWAILVRPAPPDEREQRRMPRVSGFGSGRAVTGPACVPLAGVEHVQHVVVGHDRHRRPGHGRDGQGKLVKVLQLHLARGLGDQLVGRGARVQDQHPRLVAREADAQRHGCARLHRAVPHSPPIARGQPQLRRYGRRCTGHAHAP